VRNGGERYFVNTLNEPKYRQGIQRCRAIPPRCVRNEAEYMHGFQSGLMGRRFETSPFFKMIQTAQLGTGANNPVDPRREACNYHTFERGSGDNAHSCCELGYRQAQPHLLRMIAIYQTRNLTPDSNLAGYEGQIFNPRYLQNVRKCASDFDSGARKALELCQSLSQGRNQCEPETAPHEFLGCYHAGFNLALERCGGNTHELSSQIQGIGRIWQRYSNLVRSNTPSGVLFEVDHHGGYQIDVPSGPRAGNASR
jgi:hypothetical protein